MIIYRKPNSAKLNQNDNGTKVPIILVSLGGREFIFTLLKSQELSSL